MIQLSLCLLGVLCRTPVPLTSTELPANKGTELTPGKAAPLGCTPAVCTPAERGPGENLCHARAYVSIPVSCISPCALNQAQTDAIQLCLQGGAVPVQRLGPPTADSSRLRNSPLLSAPLCPASGQVPLPTPPPADSPWMPTSTCHPTRPRGRPGLLSFLPSPSTSSFQLRPYPCPTSPSSVSLTVPSSPQLASVTVRGLLQHPHALGSRPLS